MVKDPKDGSEWTTLQMNAPMERFRQIPPGQERHFALPQDAVKPEDGALDDAYLVAIEFSDANAIRWRRDVRSRLHKLGG